MKVSNNKLPNAGLTAPNAETAKSTKAQGLDGLGETKKAKSPAVATGEMAASSRVEVSQRAQDIKKAKELATPGDSVDEAKVARLQALIDSGKYKVNAEAVAERLLDEHSKMV